MKFQSDEDVLSHEASTVSLNPPYNPMKKWNILL